MNKRILTHSHAFFLPVSHQNSLAVSTFNAPSRYTCSSTWHHSLYAKLRALVYVAMETYMRIRGRYETARYAQVSDAYCSCLLKSIPGLHSIRTTNIVLLQKISHHYKRHFSTKRPRNFRSFLKMGIPHE